MDQSARTGHGWSRLKRAWKRRRDCTRGIFCGDFWGKLGVWGRTDDVTEGMVVVSTHSLLPSSGGGDLRGASCKTKIDDDKNKLDIITKK